MKILPMTAAIRACLGIYLKNRRKTEFMQQKVIASFISQQYKHLSFKMLFWQTLTRMHCEQPMFFIEKICSKDCLEVPFFMRSAASRSEDYQPVVGTKERSCFHSAIHKCPAL